LAKASASAFSCMASPEPLRVRIYPDKPKKSERSPGGRKSLTPPSPLPEDSPVLRVCANPNALLPRKRCLRNDGVLDFDSVAPASPSPRKQRARGPVSLRRVSFSEAHNRTFVYDPRMLAEQPEDAVEGANEDAGALMDDDVKRHAPGLQPCLGNLGLLAEATKDEEHLLVSSPATVTLVLQGVSGGGAVGGMLESSAGGAACDAYGGAAGVACGRAFGETGTSWFWAEIAAMGSDDEGDDQEIASWYNEEAL